MVSAERGHFERATGNQQRAAALLGYRDYDSITDPDEADGVLDVAAALDAAEARGYEKARARVESVAVRYSADPVVEPVADQFRAALTTPLNAADEEAHRG